MSMLRVSARESTRSAAAFTIGQLRTFASSAPRNKQRLVILGSGWGGYEVLRGVDKKKWSKSLPAHISYYRFLTVTQ